MNIKYNISKHLNIFIIFILLIVISTNSIFAKKKKNIKQPTPTSINNAKQNSEAIQEIKTDAIDWITIEEAELRMKKKPKKVYMDVYTDWCGWCKVMDKKTFAHPEVIKYMNENYYCIHLNAEKTPKITYKGKVYEDNVNVNPLVLQWMQNKLSYPTSIYFDENFNYIQPIAGYLELQQFEQIVKFLSGDMYKKMPFEEFKKTITNPWK